jgi:mannitol/fructose-specific phosphotransferase system IIA component (Ntr-type)
MALADYLSEDLICMDLQSRERDDVIRDLLNMLVASKAMSAKLVERALAAILDRERLGSTAIGRGVAVPHARLEELDEVLVAFGYSQAGILFNALDSQPVHDVFLVIAPKGRADEYLDLMERITHLVQNDDFRRFVSRAQGQNEVIELIKEMDR